MDIELSSGGARFSTGNPVTDAVINEAAAICEKQKCRFDCDFSFAEDKGIAAIDMAIVLNNLLDNAIEAVAAIPPDERYIKLSGTSKDNFYLIKVENVYDGNVIRGADNNIISRKKADSDPESHGIGLKSVMNIAEKYLGAVDIRTENLMFEVKVMLQDIAVDSK